LIVAATLAGSLCACRDRVALGAWDSPGQAGAGAGGAAGHAGAGAAAGPGGGIGLPACLESGTTGPLSSTSSITGATETASDWTWPAPVTSLQWDLLVEREIERAPGSPPTSGYYFAHQFSFSEGVAGFLGIQAEGGYQQDPPSSPVEFTKIAVFWLSGPPLAGELEDIAYPDARVAPATASGVSFLTIHARFAWQACRVYRFRVGPRATEADGSTWYGASIEDTSTGIETLLGRMLLPADIGLFSPFSVSRTMPIEFPQVASCETQAPASVIFGTPSTEDGGVTAELAANRFVDPLRCTSSRFAAFSGAVRHELGLPP
jgi:hypothetical protein